MNLNHARASHAAIVLGDFLYVVGGQNDSREFVRSIERFEVTSPSDWTVVVDGVESLGRKLPGICAISKQEIAVFGGTSSKNFYCNDGAIFNTETKSVMAILGEETDRGFITYT